LKRYLMVSRRRDQGVAPKLWRPSKGRVQHLLDEHLVFAQRLGLKVIGAVKGRPAP